MNDPDKPVELVGNTEVVATDPVVDEKVTG